MVHWLKSVEKHWSKEYSHKLKKSISLISKNGLTFNNAQTDQIFNHSDTSKHIKWNVFDSINLKSKAINIRHSVRIGLKYDDHLDYHFKHYKKPNIQNEMFFALAYLWHKAINISHPRRNELTINQTRTLTITRRSTHNERLLIWDYLENKDTNIGHTLRIKLTSHDQTDYLVTHYYNPKHRK